MRFSIKSLELQWNIYFLRAKPTIADLRRRDQIAVELARRGYYLQSNLGDYYWAVKVRRAQQ